MSICRRVFYEGQVQGVGFRWTTRSIAARFPVNGWVRNLMDGRVEMLIEGEEEDVDACLARVSAHFGRMIHNHHVIPETPTGLAEGFEIRR